MTARKDNRPVVEFYELLDSSGETLHSAAIIEYKHHSRFSLHPEIEESMEARADAIKRAWDKEGQE
jgi:hypothetical protein